MRKEGKIALGIFAFHLIFGLQSLDGANGRFISPHLLDDLIIFILAIYFLVISSHTSKYILIGSVMLNAITGFIAAPQFLAIFDNFLNLESFADFLKRNESEISTLQIVVLSLFFLTSVIWVVQKLKTAKKSFKWFLWAHLLLFSAGYAGSLIFKINLIYVLSAIFIVDGLAIANADIESSEDIDSEGGFDLNETEYRYLLLIFLSMLLIILEYVSTSGLISN